jgi:hypothetical protein
MEHEKVIIDKDDDIWVLEAGFDSGDPWYINPIHGSIRLSEILKDFDPVHALARGPKIESPFKQLEHGTRVKFDRRILVPVVDGQVYSYDNENLSYRVIITVPRDHVERSS